jgi:hypothetical protein
MPACIKHGQKTAIRIHKGPGKKSLKKNEQKQNNSWGKVGILWNFFYMTCATGLVKSVYCVKPLTIRPCLPVQDNGFLAG